MRSSYLKYLLCAAIAGTAGYWLGRPHAEKTAALHNKERPQRNSLMMAVTESDKSQSRKSGSAWEISGKEIGSDGSTAARLQRVFQMNDPFSLGRAIEILGQMSAEEAPAVLELLRANLDWGNTGRSERPPLWRAFWMSWGASDPEAALASLDKRGDSITPQESSEADIFYGLSMKDPQRAGKLALTLKKEANIISALEGTISRWSEENPEEATRWVLTELEEPYQTSALGALPLTLVRRQGVAAGISWWQALPDDDARLAKTFQSLAIASIDCDALPEERIELLQAGQARGQRSIILDGVIAREYIERDPETGLQLFTSLPLLEGISNYQKINEIVQSWANADPLAAGNWVQNQTNAAWAPDAIKGYAKAISSTNPEEAAAWLRLLPTDPDR